MTTNRSREEIRKVLAEIAGVDVALSELIPEILLAGEMIGEGIRSQGRAILFGNGGSAAQAQHIAAEFVGRFQNDRQPLPAIALTTDTSALTAIANDYGFQEIFARQLKALGRPGDVALAISTSGNSANVLRGVEMARELKVRTIALTGRSGGKIRERADLCLCAPSNSAPRIQEAHLVILHILCRLVETTLVEGDGGNESLM